MWRSPAAARSRRGAPTPSSSARTAWSRVRPEKTLIASGEHPHDNRINATFTMRHYVGDFIRYYFELPDGSGPDRQDPEPCRGARGSPRARPPASAGMPPTATPSNRLNPIASATRISMPARNKQNEATQSRD